MATTVGDLLRDARYELDDVEATTYSTPELISYLNSAIRFVMRWTAANWKGFWLATDATTESTQNIVADQAAYDLPSGCYAIVTVQLTDSDGESSLLNPIVPGRAASDYANGYLVQGGQIVIYPTPEDDVENGLVIRYIAPPAEVSAEDDTLPLAAYFYDAEKDYVVKRAKARHAEDQSYWARSLEEIKADMAFVVQTVNMSEAGAGLNWEYRSFV